MASNNWCFTSFDITPITVLPPQIRYIFYGLERCPTTDRPHLQGFLCLHKRQRINGVKKLLPPGTHLELMKGNLEDNSTYCGKSGKITELGDRPKTRAQVTAHNKAIYDEIITMAEDGDLEAIRVKYPQQYLQYLNKLKTIRRDKIFATEYPQLEVLDNIWLWGKTRSGKSHLANRLVGGQTKSVRHKHAKNKWWDGYILQDNVLFDDIVPGMPFVSLHLKNWADKYSFPVEIKGSSLEIRPARLVVTSNFPIHECAPDPQNYEPLRERFTEYEMNEFDPSHYDKLMKIHRERQAAQLARDELRKIQKPDTAFDVLMKPKDPPKKRRIDLDKAAGPHIPDRSCPPMPLLPKRKKVDNDL